MSKIHYRFMIRRDLPEALEIEAASFPDAWREEDFLKCLRQRNNIAWIAERNERMVGFVIYALLRGRIDLLSIAVAPDCRYQGIGRGLINKIASKLGAGRRSEITLEVRETNLEAQKFFRAVGFKATGVLREFYADTDEDAFSMRFSVRQAQVEDRVRTG
jgi:ribosomal-protein-alanine N-acetyltransferase